MEEMNSLKRNGTQEIVKLPRDKRTMGCKQVFMIRYQANESIDRYKARLVAKGLTQIYGIDYQETFALVVNVNSIQLLLSLAANLSWPMHQLDVKNAFLNVKLEEEIFMNLPLDFESTAWRWKSMCLYD